MVVILGPWSSASNMKVLSFGRYAAAFIILVVLPLTTSIHSPSNCSLLFPFPPHRQSLLSSFLSSFTALALCFGHLSSFPLSNSFTFTYLSPICLHTLAYRKHTAFCSTCIYPSRIAPGVAFFRTSYNICTSPPLPLLSFWVCALLCSMSLCCSDHCFSCCSCCSCQSVFFVTMVFVN